MTMKKDTVKQCANCDARCGICVEITLTAPGGLAERVVYVCTDCLDTWQAQNYRGVAAFIQRVFSSGQLTLSADVSVPYRGSKRMNEKTGQETRRSIVGRARMERKAGR